MAAEITFDFIFMIVAMTIGYGFLIFVPLSWLVAGAAAAMLPQWEASVSGCEVADQSQVWDFYVQRGFCNLAGTVCHPFSDTAYWAQLDDLNHAEGVETDMVEGARVLGSLAPMLTMGMISITIYVAGFVLMVHGKPDAGVHTQLVTLVISTAFFAYIAQAPAEADQLDADSWAGFAHSSCAVEVVPLMGATMVSYIYSTHAGLLCTAVLVLSSYELYKLGVFKAIKSCFKSDGPAGTDEEMQSLVDTAERFKTKGQAKKIVMLMSHTGGGHRMSSEALSTALKNMYGEAVEVDIVDIWADYANWPFADIVNHYRIFSQYPWLWKISYDFTQFPITRMISEIISHMTSYDNFKMAIFERNPDLVVSVHPLCQHMPVMILDELNAHISNSPQMRDRLPVKLVTVVTDLASAHISWFHPKTDLTFAPTTGLRDAAIEWGTGMTADQFRVHGLPIRPTFWTPSEVTKGDMRTRLGMDPNTKTVLLMAGGDGVGMVVQQAEALAKHLGEARFYSQVVVVCGHNNAMVEDLRNPARTWPHNVKITALGFTTNIDEYMVAADLLATKAGPGTICEAMILGLPLVLTSFLPGQEEGNVPYVVDGGFGVYLEDPEEMGKYIFGILSDDAKLARQSALAKAASHPNATIDIAKDIGKICFRTTPELPRLEPTNFSEV